MSLVNVIVPCYNGEKYLDRFFLSLKEQTFKDFDIFVVDDGSTDNSKDVINKYKEIFAKENIELNYFHKENGGAASAVNVALKQNLTGKYLLIIDCDDEITQDSLEKKVDFIEKNPAYGAVTSYYEFIDNDTNQTLKIHEVRGITVNRAQTFENILLARDVVFAGYLFNKEKLFSVLQDGQIYESRGGQNWQLLLPIAYNFPIGVIKEVLYKYYVIKSSHSHSVKKTREAFEKKYKTHKNLHIFKHILLSM